MQDIVDPYEAEMLQLAQDLFAEKLPQLGPLLNKFSAVPRDDINMLYLAEAKRRSQAQKEKELKLVKEAQEKANVVNASPKKWNPMFAHEVPFIKIVIQPISC